MKEFLLIFVLILQTNLIFSTTSSYSYDSYSATSTDTSLSSQTVTSTTSDQSAVYITKSGITIKDSEITKSGDIASDTEDGEFYGVNAAVLVQGGGLTMTGGKITTSARGGNALVATNSGTVTITGTTITSTGSASARGLHATYGGTITAQDVTVSSTGGSCATLATDRGEGTVSCTNCTLSTAGAGSPLIYSTGAITVTNTTGTASAAQAIVVEGKNSATVKSSTLKCTASPNNNNDKCGVLIYQSMSGDADSGLSSFTCQSSTLEILSSSSYYNSAPFFYVTNTEANIDLNNCTFTYGSGEFLNADEGNWGSSGSNGGTVTLTLTNQNIKGNIVVGSSSSLTMTLVNSQFEGTINGNKTASKLAITLDADSTLTLTGNSYYTSLSNSQTDNSNIVTGSYTWGTYEASSSSSSSGTSPSTNGSSGGTPPDRPEGTDQNGGTPPDRPEGTNESGSPPEKPGGTNEIGSPTEKPEETDQSTTKTIEKIVGTTQNVITTTEKIVGTTQNIITTTEKIVGTTQNVITTTDKSTTNIEETTNSIGSTTNVVDNTIYNDTETNIINNNTSTQGSVVLLGFSKFNKTNTSFSFKIYFASLINFIYSRILTFPITIIRSTSLRSLQNQETISCNLEEGNSNNKLSYLCETNTDTSNINQIQINPNFKFGTQNVELTGITPLATKDMNNVQNALNNNLEKANIYVLNNSTFTKLSSNTFKISGVIDNTNINLKTNDKINLTINSNNKEVQANCEVISISNKEYTLNCQTDENLDFDLQGVTSTIGDDILVLNFESGTSIPEKEADSSPRNNYKKSNNGLNGGAITAIVLSIVLALAIALALIFLRPKNTNNEKIPNISESYGAGTKTV